MLQLIFIISKFSLVNLAFLAALGLLIYLVRRKRKRNVRMSYGEVEVISFLHPFCNDCGGGEKVLWMLVKALSQVDMKRTKKIKINILSGVKDSEESIRRNLEQRFNLDFKRTSLHVLDIELVRLHTAHLLRPKRFATMLLQIVGQVIFAFEVVTKVYSDVVIDTTGLPFCYFVLSLFGGSRVSAYVHYPFISPDMIRDVKTGVAGVHSRGIFSQLAVFRWFKHIYYLAILGIYRLNGLFVEFAMCNSSWTYNHMKQIWQSVKLSKLYPPCSVDLYESQRGNHNRKNIIVSFSQFRPEKNQKIQIDIINQLIKRRVKTDLMLFIVGSTRDEADRHLKEELENYVKKLGLTEHVHFYPNLPFDEVRKIFEVAKVGIHTMRDEHFGISIIEMMAAGLITVAHKSAGPLNDIIGPSKEPVGILAESQESYVDNLQEILEKYDVLQFNITKNAKHWAQKFSNAEFMRNFVTLGEMNKII